jgi:hypothetical protein
MTNTNRLQDAIDALTPEERDMLAKSTVQDWINAFAELVKSPTFWQDIAAAFLQGIADGLEDYNAQQRDA